MWPAAYSSARDIPRVLGLFWDGDDRLAISRLHQSEAVRDHVLLAGPSGVGRTPISRHRLRLIMVRSPTCDAHSLMRTCDWSRAAGRKR
jgi:hypothetical protein